MPSLPNMNDLAGQSMGPCLCSSSRACWQARCTLLVNVDDAMQVIIQSDDVEDLVVLCGQYIEEVDHSSASHCGSRMWQQESRKLTGRRKTTAMDGCDDATCGSRKLACFVTNFRDPKITKCAQDTLHPVFNVESRGALRYEPFPRLRVVFGTR